MNRTDQHDDVVFDLGSVTTETKGGLIDGKDSLGNRQAVLGLSDD